MPHSFAPRASALPISKQITRVFALLLIFTNALLGLLLYFQFERQLTLAWTDRYHVPLDNLAKEIEYGLQLGFSLESMENLPRLLNKTIRRYPELSTLFVLDQSGSLLAHTHGHAERFPSLAPLVKNIGQGEVDGLSLTSAHGHRMLVWSIENPFGETDGFVLLELPWADLQRIQDQGRRHLIIGIGGIVLGFLIFSLGLFRLICRDLERSLEEMDECTDRLLAGQGCVFRHPISKRLASAFADLVRRMGRVEQLPAPIPQGSSGGIFRGSNFRTRILAGALLLLLGSCTASTTVGYLIFHDLYLPVLYSQSRIIGQSLGDLINEMHGHGIPLSKMAGTERIFSDLLGGFPQIAAIGLYDAQGKRLHALQRTGADLPPASLGAQGLDDPLSVTVPISFGGNLIGMIRLDKMPHFFAKRLLDIALDVIALLVVSILIASELLTFMVRFLVTVPMEGLLQAFRGESSLSNTLPSILAFSVIHRIGQKIRSLVERAPPQQPTADTPVLTPTTRSSPLMPYVRPPLFLVVFADALSLSFFPLYVESLSRPTGWLPASLIAGLPISVFMLVWAVSLPMAGQWSDRVGRRRSFLIGALITATGLALTALAQDIIQLILVRSLTAVGYGMVYITAQSYVADHTTTRDRTKGMATFLGGFFSGSLCGAALGGILADRIGYQATFGLSALMSLMAAAFVYRFIGQNRIKSAPTGVPRLQLGDFVQLFQDRCFVPITLLTAIPAKILLTGFLYYSAPLYLRDVGASQSATGRVIMLYGLSIVLLGPVAAWMADHWHLRRSFIGFGALLSAMALGAPFLSPGGGGLLMAILMIGVAHAIAVAPQLAVITEHMQTRPDPPSMGKVIGIFRLSERVGNILGPMLFGALLTMGRPETTFLHMGFYIAVSSLLFFALLGHCHHQGPE